MKKRCLRFFLFLFFVIPLVGQQPTSPSEPYENLPIRKIVILIENQAPSDMNEENAIRYKMHTKMGDTFDQEIFDHDLKMLSEEYEWVEPSITVENKQVILSISLKKRPVITRFIVDGTSFKINKLLKEGGLKVGMKYNREEFYKSIYQIRDYLVKKGFFKAEVSYKVENSPEVNEITIHIFVHQGPKGHIRKILFEGFTKSEQKELLHLIRVKKFNALTSWLTGSGILKEEELEPDIQAIVHYMQNQGYVDAHVSISVKELPNNKLGLLFTLNRGKKYFIHDIFFSGATLKEKKELEKAIDIKPKDLFSIDKIRQAQAKIRDLYMQEGYLHSNVDYRLDLLSNRPEYNIHFTIEESPKYRVGLVVVSGNNFTQKNVLYNNIDLEPGEVFDSRKLKSTQEKLQSSGYFKNVNVYPIKNEEPLYGSSEYCDIMVEVKEAQTGHAGVFAGFSSTDSLAVGIDVTENNFSLSGFRNVWSKGVSSFRGGGQFLQVKGSLGLKENIVNISWLQPYFNNSLWRLGVELDYNRNRILTKNYDIHMLAAKVSSTYPLSSYLNYGFRFRVKDSLIGISKDVIEIEQRERKNSGIASGLATTFGYDSTDNIFKPHRGLRSNFEAEFAGLVRNQKDLEDFPFLRFSFLTSYYYPVWNKGTLKIRGDIKFIAPLSGGKGEDFPLGELFFLGGEATVRGFHPGKIGPLFPSTFDPTGGLSSALFSAEYAQNILKPLDLFVFFDSGSIAMQTWSIRRISMSYGIGARLDIGKQFPFMAGFGFPIKKEEKERLQRFFFSMAGQF